MEISSDPPNPAVSEKHKTGDRQAPLVTVVIPCFNAAAFIGEAVDSVLDQGRDDVQIVVIDDGSSDQQKLQPILARYGDQVELVIQDHLGLSAARNSGISVARGMYLALLDADDIWRPGFLQRQLDMLYSTDADLVYCDAKLFGNVARINSTLMERYPSKGKVTAASVLIKECLVVMSTVVVRTDAVRKVGGFDQTLNACEDIDLWLRMLIDGATFCYHKDPMVLRRIHAANMTADGVLMANAALEIIRRYAAVVSMSKAQRRTLSKRVRRIKSGLHTLLAWRAIKDNNPISARSEMRKAFNCEKKPKQLLGILAFTLFPKLSLRLLNARN